MKGLDMNHGLRWLATSMGAIVLFGTSACSSTRVDAEGSSASALSWTHYRSSIVEDEHPAQVDYWLRGEEVVRQYRQNGALMYDERCEGNRLTIREMLPALEDKPGFNYREVYEHDTPQACFDAATHEELGYLRARASLGKPEALQLADGRSGLRWVGATGHELVVDAATLLPVRLTYGGDESGGMTSIAFSPFSIEPASASPLPPEADFAGFQETVHVDPSEVAAVVGLQQVPSTVAALGLQHVWSYRTQNLSAPTYYLIWGDDARNVQLVSTAATLPEELRGFSADRTEYDTQEGARHVKVGTIGGDAALLARALVELRPQALTDERVRLEQPESPVGGSE